MAYRINVKGGVVPIKLEDIPDTRLKTPKYVEFLLKVPSIRVIKLNDGRRMIVRSVSLRKNASEEFNEKATKLLHEFTDQKSAVIHGPAVILFPEDFGG